MQEGVLGSRGGWSPLADSRLRGSDAGSRGCCHGGESGRRDVCAPRRTQRREQTELWPGPSVRSQRTVLKAKQEEDVFTLFVQSCSGGAWTWAWDRRNPPGRAVSVSLGETNTHEGDETGQMVLTGESQLRADTPLQELAPHASTLVCGPGLVTLSDT